MRVDLLTLFPEMFAGFFATSFVARALAGGQLAVRTRSPTHASGEATASELALHPIGTLRPRSSMLARISSWPIPGQRRTPVTASIASWLVSTSLENALMPSADLDRHLVRGTIQGPPTTRPGCR